MSYVRIRNATEEQFDDILSMCPCVGTKEDCIVPIDCFTDYCDRSGPLEAGSMELSQLDGNTFVPFVLPMTKVSAASTKNT